MIITERQEADLQIDKIIDVIKQTKLNYFIEQSPFSLRINLRKKLLHDFSPASKNNDIPTVNQHSDAKNDHIHEVKSELINTVLEVQDLKEQNKKKDHAINQLEVKVKDMERKEDLFKKELTTKAEQLKQKNKSLEGIQKNLEKIKEEKEATISNFKSKTENLEKKN